MNDATLTQTGGGAASNGPSPTPAAPPGYELLDEVGRGGMGVVHRARDVALDREVAVKILLDKYAPDSGTARRFLDEARITGQLQHPGIPAVYQVGALADGRPFLAMKLIKGQTLDELLKSGVPVDALALAEAIGQAVGYAHAHGVIHRDLKPANVMVGAFGEVQVMDWGLAKVLTASGGRKSPDSEADPETTFTQTEIRSLRDSDGSFTQAGSILGTPAFMAPEQASGELEKIDARSDVFGLGAILCVLLTGKPPFAGKDAESVRLNAIRGKTEEAFARLDASGADPDVIALAKRCLAFEPADRPATADEVASAVAGLRRAADDRARQAERDKLSAEVRAAEQAKRRRAVQRAAAAVAAVLLLGVAGTTAGLARADAARRDAETAQREAETRRTEAEAARQAEADQRQKAEVAKQQAEAKEWEANAVVWFFENKVFAAARPKGHNGGLGHDVSLLEAITASLPALTTDFAHQPLVEARLRMTLGATFFSLGDFRAALEQQEHARTIFTAQRGPDYPDTLRSMADVAYSYFTLGRHADALKLQEETLAACKRVLPPDHPHTLNGMNNLANIYVTLGRHAETLNLREEVLAAYRRVLPPDHPDTLGSMFNLAISYAVLGRHADALKLNEDALAAHKRVFPSDHPQTLKCMHNLARRYSDVGRRADALKLHEETLAARRRALPPDHPDTFWSMADVAESYAVLGRHAEALKLYEETLAARKRVLPPDHPDTLKSMNNLATSYAELGRHADALKLHEETLAVRKRVLPAGHPDTLYSMWGVAGSLLKLNRGAEAIPVIDECVSRAGGKLVNPKMILAVMALRLWHFQGKNDPAGCRATAAMWEKLTRPDVGSLYDAACFRAVTAGVQAKTPGADAARLASEDADRAMAWLTKAVAAGYKDRLEMGWDKDLDALRGRPDFQKLLASLPKVTEVAPPPRPVQ